ncbi:MAG: sulfatase [Armatimonadota bacterium]|nr:sulfatase [Armatimonadota bacterium]
MNLIVIVTDSLRYDHVGYGGGRARTPNIDAFAAESAVLDNAYGENLPTGPCRAAWWTGRHLFPYRGWQNFEKDDLLLAEYLWDKGFTSALVADTYHMHKPGTNWGRGFDTVRWVRGQEYDAWIVDPEIPVDLGTRHRFRGDPGDETWKTNFIQYLRNKSAMPAEEDYCLPRTIKSAIGWLEEVTKPRKDKLFLWVDCFDPHEPWDPPAPFREMYDPDYTGQELIDPIPGPVKGYMTPRELEHTLALYAGNVTWVDKWVGVLLDRIRDLGLYENSLIIHTSDHGEPFGEHGVIRKTGESLGYEEAAHIPWVIRHPDGTGAGKRFAGFAQPPDLAPTVLDFLGIPIAKANPETRGMPPLRESQFPVITGRSLAPMLRGERESVWDFAVTANHGAVWSIRTDEWSFVYKPRNQSRELFDRRNDLAEQKNLAGELPERAAELELLLNRFVETL